MSKAGRDCGWKGFKTEGLAWQRFDSSMASRTQIDKFISTPKLDGFASNAAKLGSFAATAAEFNSMASTVEKIDRLLGSTWKNSADTWISTYNHDFNRAVSKMGQAQRRWLAKGIRDWTIYVAKATNRLAVEVDWSLEFGLFDLKTFLYRRQLRGMERGARLARWSKRAVRAWLQRLGDELLDRLAERLRTDSRPKLLLALLKTPPGWAAMRSYFDFQATVPRMLERLSNVQAPNAPALPSGHPSVLGGNVA